MSLMRRFIQDPTCILAEGMSDLNDLRQRGSVYGNPQPIKTKWGRGLTIDGDNPDYIEMKGKKSVESDFSILVRFKFASFDSDRAIINQGDDQTAGWCIREKDEHIRFTTWTRYDYDFTYTLVLNEWYDIGIVLDSAYDASLYINGDFQQKVDRSNGGKVSSGKFTLGSRFGGGIPSYGDGQLFLVYRRGLSAQEFLNIYKDEAF